MDTWLIIIIVIICVIAVIIPLSIARWKYVNSSEYRSKETAKATKFDDGHTFILVGEDGSEQKLTTDRRANRKANKIF